ncbi:MAG TPA: permease-like cell division protein FtsX [Myxococcaceae bacterium]|nr:permease-like cell division protein FtsX [Myxococcaceae bacterium]
MSVLAKGTYFWRSAAQGVRHAPFVHFIAVITIAIALFTAGMARGLWQLLDSLIATLGGQVELTVYLDQAAAAWRAEEVAQALRHQSGLDAHVVPPEEAMARLKLQLGELGSALDGLPENPLPRTVELTIPARQRTPEQMKALAEQARALPGVTAVDYGEEAVARLSSIASAARAGGLLASLIVAIATIVIVSATLQLAIYSRRGEIEIQKLVGATDRFVKAPFLIEGVLQGLLGALCAALGLWAFAVFAGPPLQSLFSFLLGPHGGPPLVTAGMVAELFGAGAVLGLCGSFVAVGRFLRV